MKKLSILASLLFAMHTVTSQTSQKSGTNQPMIDHEIKGQELPASILSKFKNDYPGEQPTWSTDNGNYRAVFVDGSKMYGHAVAYDMQGNVVYREERIASSNYPSGVTSYYTTNYPNDKYEVWASTDKSGKKKYYSNHNLETLWFDENGTYVSKTKVRN
jgi:hypothetical protein